MKQQALVQQKANSAGPAYSRLAYGSEAVQQDEVQPDLLDELVQEGFEGCNADVPQLCCDASTPLHKFDIVEVVLHPSEVGKAKGSECRIPPPVDVLPPLNDLSSIGRSGWHGVYLFLSTGSCVLDCKWLMHAMHEDVRAEAAMWCVNSPSVLGGLRHWS